MVHTPQIENIGNTIDYVNMPFDPLNPDHFDIWMTSRPAHIDEEIWKQHVLQLSTDLKSILSIPLRFRIHDQLEIILLGFKFERGLVQKKSALVSSTL